MDGCEGARVCHLLKPDQYKNKSLWAVVRLLIVLGDDIERKLLGRDSTDLIDAA